MLNPLLYQLIKRYVNVNFKIEDVRKISEYRCKHGVNIDGIYLKSKILDDRRFNY